jgi:hypothetical protein
MQKSASSNLRNCLDFTYYVHYPKVICDLQVTLPDEFDWKGHAN